MKITFVPLQEEHFPLLQKWLNAPHLAATWGEKKQWTLEKIKAKYIPYTQRHKKITESYKNIFPFVIYFEKIPIGYIQYYNAYDFPRETGHFLTDARLPKSLAALDLYIGEPHFMGKGVGSVLLMQFLKIFIWPHFKACFVDPDNSNFIAIRAYEKAGFKKIGNPTSKKDSWMICKSFE